MIWWKIYFVLLLLLTLLFPFRPIYVAFYAIALVLYGGSPLLRYPFSRMAVTRDQTTLRMFPGENAVLGLVLRNPTMVPIPWVSLAEKLPTEFEAGRPKRWVDSLPPKTSTTYSYTVTGRQRGIYELGPLALTAGDSLGMFQTSDTDKTRTKVVVYPTIHPLPELRLPSQLPLGNVRARQRIHPDPARLAGVRPYQSGDTLQSIHWKATARTGDLQVKLYEHTVSVDCVLLLNLREQDYPVERFHLESEWAIETCASLGNYLAGTGESFALITNGFPDSPLLRMPSRKGTTQLTQVLETLAAVRCQTAPPFPQVMQDEAKHFAWGATLLVVTPVDSPELVQSGLALTRAGYKVLLFVVGKTVLHRQLVDRPAYSSLSVFPLPNGPAHWR